MVSTTYKIEIIELLQINEGSNHLKHGKSRLTTTLHDNIKPES